MVNGNGLRINLRNGYRNKKRGEQAHKIYIIII